MSSSQVHHARRFTIPFRCAESIQAMSYIPQESRQRLGLEPSPQALARNGPSPFWAVLIGIDAYPAHPLNGCVSDARAMGNYLINHLGVPEGHIRRLLCPRNDPSPNDSDLVPTRANIVDTILGLYNDARIQFGDNIIIYFAGHGASYECQNHEDNSGQVCLCGIEAMCPSDRNTVDYCNNIVTDITDRELNTILTQICHAKGRKITVILDCCFSASLVRASAAQIPEGVRSMPPSHLQQEELSNALRTADDTFRDLGFPDYRCILDEEWYPDMKSHVVLAACSEHEFAREVRGSTGNTNGAFTQALVQVLKSDLTGGETYMSVLSLLTMSSNQTPVVAGTHMNELLWQ